MQDNPWTTACCGLTVPPTKYQMSMCTRDRIITRFLKLRSKTKVPIHDECMYSPNLTMRSIFSERSKFPRCRITNGMRSKRHLRPLAPPPPDASKNELDTLTWTRRMVLPGDALKRSARCPAHPWHSTVAPYLLPTARKTNSILPPARKTQINLQHVLILAPHRVSGLEDVTF